MSAPLLWAERTWEEIPGALGAVKYAALLPVGATEQHGPHLGCGMDFALADAVCRAVSERTGVPMLPTLPYGCSLGHSRRWPGTIALDPILMTDLVRQIGTQAYHSGVRRLFLVNAHVTNAAPLRCALELLRSGHDDLMVALVNTATVSERVRAAHFADAEDWHANRAETALMQALAPDLVREDRIARADDPDRTGGLVFAHPVNRTSRNGVTGRPSLANRAEGAELFAWMVEDLAALVRRGLAETPPLPHSYDGPAVANEGA
ncbi:creatininase family protein [Methylobacterium durans]|uniref:creatininase family protein n=1 Tax=Methylobacterium durans TaxID=2202825 RepID=UPI002AFEE378|nr:creatininase family protein [Methylobacterium durans]MEA1835154.1 creatininase family protein [Methylobacterium durans]